MFLLFIFPDTDQLWVLFGAVLMYVFLHSMLAYGFLAFLFLHAYYLSGFWLLFLCCFHVCFVTCMLFFHFVVLDDVWFSCLSVRGTSTVLFWCCFHVCFLTCMLASHFCVLNEVLDFFLACRVSLLMVVLLFFFFCSIMAHSPDKIKSIDGSKETLKLSVRINDLWFIGTPNKSEQAEMVFVDSNVCFNFVFFL